MPGTKSVIAERISEGYYVDVQNDLERMAAARRDGRRGDATVRYAHRRRQHRSAIKQADNTVVPLERAVLARVPRHPRKGRNTPVVTGDGRAVPLGEVADVSVRKMPEMIRNDNGKLAGYIYVDLRT